MDLKNYIRSVKDFPKEGIMFRDITTLLLKPEVISEALNQLYLPVKDLGITKVAAIESRGFIFGALLADKLGAGFVPVRKKGKLPADKYSESYSLEYGTDTIEMHQDALSKDDFVLLHDDLLATGGTAKAAANLIKKAGANLACISFLIELTFIPGRKMLDNYNVVSIIEYHDEN